LKKKIAFMCVHNSCRSQIAEALGKMIAGDRFEFFSAGTCTKPGINQDAVRLMKEIYGIDMEKFDHFVAFKAALELLYENGKSSLIDETYRACIEELKKPDAEQVNCTRAIYSPFDAEEISRKIADLLKPVDLKADLELVFQSLEGLHSACPNHLGDWYFSGKYPTPGGNRLVNEAFVYHYETYLARK
jgi:amidophosphoribosyltransferase